MISITASLTSIESIASALISWRASPNVVIIAGPDKIGPDFIFSEDGFDVEDSVFDEGSGSVVVVELEFPVAATR